MASFRSQTVSSENSQIPFPIGTPDFAIQRPSDQVWLHFETYREDYGDESEGECNMWGFNLWMIAGYREFQMSEAVFTSEADVKSWLIAHADEWRYISGNGWCFPDMERKLPEPQNSVQLKF
jgi:hypothetical protein